MESVVASVAGDGPGDGAKLGGAGDTCHVMAQRDFQIHLSDDQASLADVLATQLREEPEDPLRPREVVVQNRGMERWLRYRIAARNGIAMNLHFPFPRQTINSLLSAFLPGRETSPAFERANMTWAIHDLLPTLVDRSGFALLRRYLADGEPIKRYWLADHIAGLFDEYIVYRPTLVARWSRGDDFDWQAEVWRAIRALWPEALCFADLHTELVAGAEKTISRDDLRTSVVRVFGISMLPPAFLDVLARVAELIPVHVFLLTPTHHYFGDLSDRRRSRESRCEVEAANDHPASVFLARTARQAREMIDLLLDRDAVVTTDLFREGSRTTSLDVIRGALREIELPDAESFHLASEQALPTVVLSAASSPSREVQVLRTHLLGLFEQLRDLRPEDILVMAPEIETYSAAIHAEFGTVEPGIPDIRYRVADLQPRTEYRAIDAFMRCLDLVGSAFRVTDVFGLIEHEAMRRALNLGDADVEKIRVWLTNAGVHWGYDANQRLDAGQPALAEGTWRHGIDSILLGYAMDGADTRLFDGHCPESAVEGERVRAVGELDRMLRLLGGLETARGTARRLADWAAVFGQFAKELFGGRDEFILEYFEILRVCQALESLPAAKIQSTDIAVSFEAVRASLGEMVREFVQSGGFLSGGITFSSLRPMRSVPARVICLLGLNEKDFPRPARRSSFDLIGRHPEPGDRSPRNEDRQVFLESVLCARDVLYLSYVGIDARNGEPLPCSVVLDEFCELIKALPGDVPISKTVHPLQPFSQRYVSDSATPTYSRMWWETATRLLEPPGVPAAFFSRGIEPLSAGESVVDVARFVQFFASPAAAFLERRLGVQLSEWNAAELDDAEPFVLDKRQRFEMTRRAVDRLLRGENASDWSVPESRTRLSFGAVGKAERAEFTALATAFVKAIDGVNPPGDELTIDADLGDGYRVTGKLQEIHHGRLVIHHPARGQARHLLSAWIRHVLRQTVPGSEGEKTTTVCFLDKDGCVERVRLLPVDPEPILAVLGRIFREGLNRPIPFFPTTTFRFAEGYQKTLEQQPDAVDEARRKGLSGARAAWRPGFDGAPGDGQTPEAQRLFDETTLEHPEFEAMALAVWMPYLSAHETIPEVPL